MELREEGKLLIVKFTQGDIIANLQKLVLDQNIHSAVLISGIGMLCNAVIGFFDGDKYSNHTVEGAAELVSLQGNIGREVDTGDVVCHLHASLATADHSLVGGHLFEGTVTVVNEIVLYHLRADSISRLRNQQGLFELHLE